MATASRRSGRLLGRNSKEKKILEQKAWGKAQTGISHEMDHRPARGLDEPSLPCNCSSVSQDAHRVQVGTDERGNEATVERVDDDSGWDKHTCLHQWQQLGTG